MQARERLLSLFPPPAYLAMPLAGIDISDRSVKCVILGQKGGRIGLSSYMEIPLPGGAVVEGDIEEPDKVVEILRSVRLRLGVHHAAASLSERKAYLYQTLAPGNKADFGSSVESDLEEHIPLPPGEVFFDFEVVRRVEEGTILSVTAYARRIVEMYEKVFRKAGIVLRSLEVESQALARAALSDADKEKALMLIDFGRRTTRIAITENGVVVFTATLDVGGDTLTTAIMKLFSVPEEEAERIKNEKGFLMNEENKNLVEALMTTVSVVKDEIMKHLNYWNTPASHDLPRRNVEKIIICGGNANLRGFPEYLEGTTGLPVSIANVWNGVFSFDAYVPPMPFPLSLEYATSIGLAERGLPSALW